MAHYQARRKALLLFLGWSECDWTTGQLWVLVATRHGDAVADKVADYAQDNYQQRTARYYRLV